MFVSLNNCREIYNNNFFNDRKLPKGNKSERLVYLTLQLFSNPKGNFCTNFFFDMLNENKFVENSQYAISTQQINDLLNSIYDFFSTANPSQYLLAQNQLLNKFIESENETEIGTMFFLSSTQSEFITNLFEQIQNINKIKTEA